MLDLRVLTRGVRVGWYVVQCADMMRCVWSMIVIVLMLIVCVDMSAQFEEIPHMTTLVNRFLLNAR